MYTVQKIWIPKEQVNNFKHVRRMFKSDTSRSQKSTEDFFICGDKKMTELVYLRHSGGFQLLTVLHAGQDHSG